MPHPSAHPTQPANSALFTGANHPAGSEPAHLPRTMARTGVVAVLTLCVLITLTATARAAHAVQNQGSSSAFGESISVQVLPLLGSPVQVSSGPLPLVQGSAAPAYSLTDDLASIQVSVPSLGTLLQTDLLTVDAASTEPDSDQASADATIAAVRLRLAAILPVLTLSADAVGSTAQISGPCHQPSATGSTTLVNAQLRGPLGIGLGLLAQPAPNTVVLDQAGLRVVLNEQTSSVSSNAFSVTTSLTVNAVHVSLAELPLSGLGLVSGDIILSQSQAQLQCNQVIRE
jgi:hypothetical protein